ncbi:Zinc finger CCHC domain-containing 9 [Gossypium arboreum]|uniref:Zinc finger CCHC domain-containing 9 n=1 Tax=Gossypium arboreum TaxID=29729 RepID=A0A0B0MH94_GOSAR|nr:Zinc finger CCHC domain-containing 9 [Gossypium arboreum]
MANKRQKLARKQYKEAHPELFPTPQPTAAKDPDKKKKKKNSKFKRKREGSKELKSPNNGYKKGIRKHPLRVPGMRPGESCYICKAKDHIAKLCPQKAQWEKHMGGCCKICGGVTHLAKDCPDKGKRASISANREGGLSFGTDERPTGKVTKFSSGDDLEDDFIIQEPESATNDAKIKSKNQTGPKVVNFEG